MREGRQPAFPMNEARGLTKREYYAAAAMQGILSDQHNAETPASDIARWSIQCADALIWALGDPG